MAEVTEKKEQSVDPDPAVEHMLFEILLSLPAKDVGRFLCVSKYWATTIAGRDFVRSYSLRFSPEKQPPRLLLAFNTQVKGYQEGWYFFSTPQCLPEPDPVLRTTPRPEPRADFVSSWEFQFKKQCYKNPCYAHGLMSFLYGDEQVISNPTTGKSITLPPATVRSQEMVVRSFLGYDPIDAQYKVLCLTNVTRTAALFLTFLEPTLCA
ncbi:unnamed protein product [Microthlaspi erraticum]|uniref:Uncharacterized protein n=1 Tax=Microthlaspi erraticum TaxID=1685480 RepID=A0A6D2HN88_9BRAS|nr:unnamed protein product [Microthlaspi erraticum]